MSTQPLIKYLKQLKEVRFLTEEVKTNKENLIYGVSGSQKSMLASLLLEDVNKPLLYIVESAQRGKEIFDDLNNLLAGKTIHFYPSLDVLPFEVLAQSHEVQQKRVEILYSLIKTQGAVVITTMEALGKTLIPPKVFKDAVYLVEYGQRIEIDEMLSHLISVGYQRVDMVEGKGQVSLRGGILDVFSSTEENPYRIEFFDDEVDSIREFSIESQRSIKNVNSISIPPAAEFFVPFEDKSSALNTIQAEGRQLMKSMEKRGNRQGYELLSIKLSEIMENIKNNQNFFGYDQFRPYFYKEKYTILNYFNDSPFIILDEPNRQRESSVQRDKDTQETFKVLLEKGKILPGQISNYLNFDEILQLLSGYKKIYFSLLPKKPVSSESVNPIGITAKSPGSFMGKTKFLVDELKEWRRQRIATLIMVNSQERGERLRQNLWDLGIETVVVSGEYEIKPGNVYISTGFLTYGFEFTTWRCAILTERELFHQAKKRLPRKIFKEGKKVTILEDLKSGDYVVHYNHGIGRYIGIEQLSVGDAERDYLVIKYQGEDKVYVPTDQAGLLQKYFYQEGQKPKLSKLGGNEWNKVKNKVKSAVKDLAQDLLALYAARQSQPGYAFSKDSPWQKEFEEDFPFEETPDQIKAINEVKKDMENDRPMDRLLCGDVGYGKTEVAIRAAFKAVTNGKQVAVLVPTTVLAQQHNTTFRERFEGFAVNVGVLSRFRTPKEQREVIKGLLVGTVDIVIGTHRLLSTDIKFKDLGLLIIDEEQRFGVAHKEKLKRLRKTVDVLTLTATPIPRTLHMSLVGARDMSLIETPPEDRYPVQTFVVEYSEHMVREAIRREIGRGGQVYYVHNRVEDIDKTAALVQNLVPEARVAIGHGKMTEEQLERVMLEFMEGNLDVLVCTTIIETGLDISNVNTLIIDNADKLGLSQLYQIRGRVGRSNRIAYSYLTYQRDKILSEVAEKRLNAIREFTELGSGFKIAMRDLEIRGAGNILGAEQHGQVAAVGFDLYCRMLEEAVREAKGEDVKEEKEINIDLQVKAYIPKEYISDTSVKINFYQRIYGVRDNEEIKILEEELIDRFGDIPKPLFNLLKIASIKVLAQTLHIVSINQDKDIVRVKLGDQHGMTGPQLMALARNYRRQVSFNTSSGLEILINIRNLDSNQMLTLLEDVLMEISSIAQKDVALV